MSLSLPETFWRMAIAIGLGLLVGLQREHAASSRIAGLRSFALFSLFGYLCGLLAAVLGVWLPVAGMLALAAVLLAGNLLEHRGPDGDPGITTEVSALLVFGVGVYLASGTVSLGIAIGVVIATLLAFKVELHSLAHRLEEADFKAALQFALLSFVVLPVLPDQTFGPYGVLNPRNIWWMVLLIVGIGFAGYIAHKTLPASTGLLLGGVIGGLVSSTATTISYARRVSQGDVSSGLAATVIAMASAVVFGRLMIEVSVVAPGWARQALPPLGLLLAVMIFLALALWWTNRTKVRALPLSNPSQTGVALLFAGIYSLVLLASAAARDLLGDQGLYLVAAISGITDVDAITLSTARMVETGRLSGDLGWRVVLTATLANIAAKAMMAAAMGGRPLLMALALPFGATLMVGLAAILWW